VKLWLIAVGQRMPAWADMAFADYAKRFPPDCPLKLKAVKAQARTSGKTAAQLMAAEAARIEIALPKGVRRVVLDEEGARFNTAQLTARLQAWRQDGRDVAFIIGGADGLDATLRSTADETLRLSDLTLPHALARVVLAEALYRSWTVWVNHPYHRE
jgi:23S rRNA (pseudouridine1915-N3)-methyltransferase